MPGKKPMNRAGGAAPSADDVGAGAPDPSACVARLILRGEPPAWCLAPLGHECRFSQPFGEALLCCHPQRDRIVARKGTRG